MHIQLYTSHLRAHHELSMRKLDNVLHNSVKHILGSNIDTFWKVNPCNENKVTRYFGGLCYTFFRSGNEA
jgi:hypothetical protein